MRRIHLNRAVPLLILAAACQDVPSSPEAPVLPETPDAPVPDVAPQRPRGVEGFLRPGTPGTGFILGRDGEPLEIAYEVHGGLAVWEGDIVLGPVELVARSAQEVLIRSRQGGDAAQGVVIDGAGFRWPGGVVPFEIDGTLPNQTRVTDAIATIEQGTAGVTLVPRNGEANFVRFVPGDGCSSPIGMQGGQQNITLDTDCSAGNAAHEILHALGMYHEHTRCDRDDFVTINIGNVESGKEHNFDKNCTDATDIGEYDEGSMMHYGPFAFAVDNTIQTITSLRGLDNLMGQRAAVGPTDAETIAELYGVNNDPPTAVIAPLAASYPEGSPVNFDGSGSSDPDDAVITWAWTFGDGTCTVVSPPAACTQESPTHTYADNGSYSVTLTVSDGFLNDVANATATVVNVDPVVAAGADDTVDEGSLYSGSGSFVDPGADTWTATVDYGDGSGVQALTLAGKNFNLSHTYVDNGVYTVTVTVTDDDGGSGSDVVEVTVLNVAPTVDAGADAEVTSGETFDLVGTFSDPGILDATWTWEIDWGFGPNSTGSTDDQSATIEASRQVCVAGTYDVVLSVTDKDGGTGTDGLVLTVPYFMVDLSVSPGGEPNAVNLGKKGFLPVAVLSTPEFDATTIDPSTVVLGDEMGADDTPVALQNNGRYHAKLEDVNADGLTDMVLMFDVLALAANGDLTALSTTVVLRGFLDDACVNFRGEGPVTIRPS